MGRNRTGAKGADVVLKVPVGTQIFEEDNETLIADLDRVGQRVLLAKGGNGGFGNAHFKTSTNQAPRRANPGLPGQERTIWLRLKLIADAGLVGLPNAGKSTFLAAVTAAKPKIADYPFTTLHPGLGVARVDGREFVIADIPGLIEGAHEGVGLGDRFLGHVERCRVLLHLVDGTGEDPAEAYKIVREELDAYGDGLDRQAGDRRAVARSTRSTPRRPPRKKALAKPPAGSATLPSRPYRRGVEAVLRALPRRDRRGRRAACVTAPSSIALDRLARSGRRRARDAPSVRAGTSRPCEADGSASSDALALFARRLRRPTIGLRDPARNYRRIIVKIGSALLVDRAAGLKRDWLASLADDLAALAAGGADLLVVSSGAIALGRSVLGARPARAEARGEPGRRRRRPDRARPRLVGGARQRHGLTAGQILLTLGDTEERRRYLNARATIATLLKLGASRSSTRTTRSRPPRSATATTTGSPRASPP